MLLHAVIQPLLYVLPPYVVVTALKGYQVRGFRFKNEHLFLQAPITAN